MFLSADGRALCLVLPFTPACGSLFRASEFCRQLRIARSASPSHLQHLHHRIDMARCASWQHRYNSAEDTPKAQVQAKRNRHESWLFLSAGQDRDKVSLKFQTRLSSWRRCDPLLWESGSIETAAALQPGTLDAAERRLADSRKRVLHKSRRSEGVPLSWDGF